MLSKESSIILKTMLPEMYVKVIDDYIIVTDDYYGYNDPWYWVKISAYDDPWYWVNSYIINLAHDLTERE